MGEVFAQPQQPCPGLRGCFEHKYARQHGKLRKVVGQVLFGERHVLRSRERDVRLVRPNRIQQPKTHGSYLRSALPSSVSMIPEGSTPARSTTAVTALVDWEE